jgi:hypothetical protein
MKASIYQRIEMGLRVRDFNWAHPWSYTSYIAATDRLAERVARAQALAERPGTAWYADSSAELDSVTGEIMGLVWQIDALNWFRFRNDAESLRAWWIARNDATPESGIQPAA